MQQSDRLCSLQKHCVPGGQSASPVVPRRRRNHLSVCASFGQKPDGPPHHQLCIALEAGMMARPSPRQQRAADASVEQHALGSSGGHQFPSHHRCRPCKLRCTRCGTTVVAAADGHSTGIERGAFRPSSSEGYARAALGQYCMGYKVTTQTRRKAIRDGDLAKIRPKSVNRKRYGSCIGRYAACGAAARGLPFGRERRPEIRKDFNAHPSQVPAHATRPVDL